MPLPAPSKKQDKNSFISSCVSSDVMKKEFPDMKRRLAVCFSQFKRKKKQKQANGFNEDPTWKEVEQEPVLYLD